MTTGTTGTAVMRWRRMPIEEESPEEIGYEKIVANLAESSCRDRTFKELGCALEDLVLLYGDHRGHRGAREVLAAEAGVAVDDVLLTSGAAMALFLAHTVLLGGDRHLVVVRPNYATNIETPWAIGSPVTHVDLRFEDGYRTDVRALEQAITPRTTLVSITTPHNPTGVELAAAEVEQIAAMCTRRGVRLLVDQTYGDVTDGAPLPPAAGRGAHVLSVSSTSKTYGVPGLRAGWIISTDRALMTSMLAAKEQIVLCGSMVDEALAFEVLQKRAVWLPEVKAHIARQRASVASSMSREARLEGVAPTGGVVAFPRVRRGVPFVGERFYQALMRDHQTMVGPGHWFGQRPESFRLGFGAPTESELAHGLRAISAALDVAAPG